MVHELLAADDVATPHGVRQVVDDLVDLDDGARCVRSRRGERLQRVRQLEVPARRVHRRRVRGRLGGLRQRLVREVVRVAEQEELVFVAGETVRGFAISICQCPIHRGRVGRQKKE